MTRTRHRSKSARVSDRAECLRIAVSAVAEAAAGGARLIVFPEAFIPGYPAWIWRLRPGGDMALSERLHRALLENAVDLANDDLGPLRDAAREHGVTVVCGINERDGDVQPRHALQHGGHPGRAMAASSTGIASSCRPIPSAWCGARATRRGSGRSIARAAGSAPSSAGRATCRSRATRCMRRGSTCTSPPPTTAAIAGSRRSSTSRAKPDAGWWVAALRFAAPISAARRRACSDLYPDPDEWINAGDSAVVAPGGKVALGPLRNDVGILYADINSERHRQRAADTGCHGPLLETGSVLAARAHGPAASRAFQRALRRALRRLARRAPGRAACRGSGW